MKQIISKVLVQTVLIVVLGAVAAFWIHRGLPPQCNCTPCVCAPACESGK